MLRLVTADLCQRSNQLAHEGEALASGSEHEPFFVERLARCVVDFPARCGARRTFGPFLAFCERDVAVFTLARQVAAHARPL
jgi:hypothetical protein